MVHMYSIGELIAIISSWETSRRYNYTREAVPGVLANHIRG